VDHVYTLSTRTGQHGHYPDVPNSQIFPVPYSDNFESVYIFCVIRRIILRKYRFLGYPLYGEAKFFADQSGVFEIAVSEGNQYMMQVNAG